VRVEAEAGSVGRVYAEALFAIANETGAIDELLDEVSAVEAVFRENPTFGTLLDSPKVTREEAERMIRETFGNQIGRHTLNLLLVLMHRGRQRALPQVAAAFRAMVDAHRKQRRVRVTTATPLEPAAASRLAEALSRRPASG
jgi:F-type H+-transporting ATPase subunit delta